MKKKQEISFCEVLRFSGLKLINISPEGWLLLIPPTGYIIDHHTQWHGDVSKESLFLQSTSEWCLIWYYSSTVSLEMGCSFADPISYHRPHSPDLRVNWPAIFRGLVSSLCCLWIQADRPKTTAIKVRYNSCSAVVSQVNYITVVYKVTFHMLHCELTITNCYMYHSPSN